MKNVSLFNRSAAGGLTTALYYRVYAVSPTVISLPTGPGTMQGLGGRGFNTHQTLQIRQDQLNFSLPTGRNSDDAWVVNYLRQWLWQWFSRQHWATFERYLIYSDTNRVNLARPLRDEMQPPWCLCESPRARVGLHRGNNEYRAKLKGNL